MLNFLPYALAAYGGYKGYQSSKQAGGSGIQRILGGSTGAAMGYYGGQAALSGGAKIGLPGFAKANTAFTPFTQLANQYSGMSFLPFQQAAPTITPTITSFPTGDASVAEQIAAADRAKNVTQASQATGDGRTLLEKLFYKKNIDPDSGNRDIDPLKVFGLTSLAAYGSGAFEQGPTDIYMPTYNIAYPELARQRGGFKYIDPDTGQEKTYDQPYIPEGNQKGMPVAIEKVRLREGGLAEVQKFNEGGINYLPSKTSHDENDSTNYVRATGYVEDGSGLGDKDEDTMLAQLADGEFVTRADGVLGAGIIAGGNPNSMKDMRAKGAQYFYEQQKRYKRVFDLIQEANGKNSKTN